MVIVSIAVFVVVIFLLWKVAKLSARIHRQAYGPKVQPPIQHYHVSSRPYGEGRMQEVTNIVNVYPGREWGYSDAPSSGYASQDSCRPYETGYTGLWE